MNQPLSQLHKRNMVVVCTPPAPLHATDHTFCFHYAFLLLLRHQRARARHIDIIDIIIANTIRHTNAA